MKKFFDESRKFSPIGINAENLAGEFFLVTGSGKFFRNIQINPEDNIAIIEIDETGANYRIAWGLKKGGAPQANFTLTF